MISKERQDEIVLAFTRLLKNIEGAPEEIATIETDELEETLIRLGHRDLHSSPRQLIEKEIAKRHAEEEKEDTDTRQVINWYVTGGMTLVGILLGYLIGKLG